MRTSVVVRLAAVALIVLVGLGVLGLLPRRSLQRLLVAEADTTSHALPIVPAAKVQPPTNPTTLLLPGTMESLHEASLYSRVTGYVSQWHADIGTRVHKGQLLAVLSAPELDANVRQFGALLAQAQTTLSIARSNYERWRLLYADSAVTAQSFQLVKDTLQSAGAAVRAAEASLAFQIVMQKYKEIRAPFDGTVTARNVDYGTLVSATGAASTPLTAGGTQLAPPISIPAASLFQIGQTDTMRVYIDVPQPDAASIRAGMPAELIVADFARRTFPGKVARAAHAVDLQSHTLLVEIDVPNPERMLLPGMYAQARITINRIGAPLMIPSTALANRSHGPQVIQLIPVDSNTATIHTQYVEVGRDFGSTLEITSGLKAGAIVATIGTQLFTEGQKVRYQVTATPSTTAPTAPAGAKPAY